MGRHLAFALAWGFALALSGQALAQAGGNASSGRFGSKACRSR